MPTPGKAWRHVTINTYCSWLKGDRRGFRSRNHEIHSSGDYRKPPPPEEHAGLRRHFEGKSNDEIHIGYAERRAIGQAILRWCRDSDHAVLAIAVSKVHAHWLVELLDDMRWIPRIVGDAKRISSRAVKITLPGKVWSRDGQYKRIKNRGHQQSVHDYIVFDQGLHAWTWSYLDDNDDGMYGRCRPSLRSGRP